VTATKRVVRFRHRETGLSLDIAVHDPATITEPFVAMGLQPAADNSTAEDRIAVVVADIRKRVTESYPDFLFHEVL